MNELQRIGFLWTVDLLDRNGRLIDRTVQHNLMPTAALNFMHSAIFGGASVPADWYIALFEGDYIPQPSDTAATIVASATECTTYDEAARQVYTASSPVSGSSNNYAAPAEFTSNADKTIYGGFIISSSAKSATTGTLLSAARFSVPRGFDNGYVLRVKAGFAFASL